MNETMRMVRMAAWSAVLSAIVTGSAQAAVVYATDFNGVTPGVYTDNVVLNSGGITTDNVTVRSGTGSATTVVDRGGGNNALQLTDASTDSGLAGNPKAHSANFAALSTGATGENRLTGSFDYTRLLSVTAGSTSPTFAFIVSSGGQTNPGSGTAAVQLSVESSGVLFYNNGTTGTNSGYTLATGVEYRFSIDADFSSATQDTWSLTVTPLTGTQASFVATNIGTRAANVSVNNISMLGGLNVGATNASPFAQIDNINFESSAVPEPAAATVLLAAGAALLRRRKH